MVAKSSREPLFGLMLKKTLKAIQNQTVPGLRVFKLKNGK